ncbi:WD40 repeat protein [Mycena kentingensis (nom. inval.)]|nr:WD40 repeat protein [Mycena kentingensis (nom. inval.)]
MAHPQSPAYSLFIESADRVSWNPGLYHRKRPNLLVKIDQGGGRVVQTPTKKRELAPKWDFAAALTENSSNTIALRLYHDSTFPGRAPAFLGECKTSVHQLMEKAGEQVELDIKAKNRLSARLSVRLSQSTPTSPRTSVDAGAKEPDAESPSPRRSIDPSPPSRRPSIDMPDPRMLIRRMSSTLTRRPGNTAREQGPGRVTGRGRISFDLDRSAAAAPSPRSPSAPPTSPREAQAAPPALATSQVSVLLESLNGAVSSLERIARGSEADSEKVSLHIHVAWKILSAIHLTEKTRSLDAGYTPDVGLVSLAKAIAGAVSLPFEFQLHGPNDDDGAPLSSLLAFCILITQGIQGLGGVGLEAINPGVIARVSTALVELKKGMDAGVEREDVDFVSVHSLQTQPIPVDALPGPTCVPGTRHDILAELASWLLSAPTDSESNVLCLHAPSGTGKTTVANTLARFAASVDRLGAFVSRSTGLSPAGILNNIAKQLGFDSADGAIPLRSLFAKRLVEPLLQAELHTPMSEVGRLPGTIRLLITHTTPLSSTNILNRSLPASRSAITTFLRASLAQTRRAKGITNAAWPGASDATVQLLAEHAVAAGGGFAWATVAMRFVASTYDPRKRLAILLAPGPNNGGGSSLDGLYRTVLGTCVDWRDTSTAADARRVLHALVLVQTPLTDVTLDALLGQPAGRTATLFRLLSCLVSESSSPAQFIHQSLATFLAHGSRSDDPWYLAPSSAQQSLALGCLRVLNAQLRFNLCGLDSSHALNAEIPDLAARVEVNLSPALTYAVRFWAHHLSGAEPAEASDELTEELRVFFERKVLFWLEALSVVGQYGLAYGAVEVALQYARQQDNEDSLTGIIYDTLRFVSAFGVVIAQSAPHIYISALAFAPQKSLLKQQYASSFPNLLQHSGPLAEYWPSLQRVLRGHERGVTSVAFSPDGKHIASGSWDNTVHIRDAQTGALLFEPLVGHTNGVTSLAHSASGTRAAGFPSGSRSSGTPRASPPSHSPPPAGGPFPARTTAPRVWDTDTGVLVAGPFTGHAGPVHAVALSPDGRRIVTASTDKTARVWSLASGAVVAVFKLHAHWVNCVAFSPDGRHVASGSNDHAVYVWDADSGEVTVGPVQGHRQAVSCIAFSPDGAYIITGSTDGTLRLWSALSGRLAAGPFEGHTGIVSGVFFSPDGLQGVSSSDDCSVRVWDLFARPLTASPTQNHYGAITSVAYSPNGAHILAGCGDTAVWLYDASSGLPATPKPLSGHLGRVTTAVFSPDGTHVASCSTDETIRVWNLSTGAVVRVLRGHKKGVTAVAYSPDGMRLISGSQDRSVRIWQLFSPQVLGPSKMSSASNGAGTGAAVVRQLKAHTDWVSCVAFSPSGNQIATGSDDQMVYIADAHTGALVAGPLKHRAVVTSIAFSPNDGGKRLVSASRANTICVWDTASGARLLGPIEGHADWVNAVAWSTDGRYIVSGSDDKTVRVWDAKSGELVAGPFFGHAGAVRGVAFSPDERFVVSGSEDGTVRVWRLSSSSGKIQWGPHPQLHDRWILDASSERVMRIPPWLKEDVCYPWNELVIRPEGVESIDLTRFVCGDKWGGCFQEQFS